jgi:hypothetical protein
LNDENDVFNGYGIRVRLKRGFTKVTEALSRIGYAKPGVSVLYQSCHLFHKRGEYAIMHFKELLEFDGKDTDTSDNDIARRNRIASLLEEWGYVEIIDKDECYHGEDPMISMSNIKIVSLIDKPYWRFEPKYTFNKRSDVVEPVRIIDNE